MMGKNHGKPHAAKYTMREKITVMEAQGQRPLAPPLFASRGSYNGGNYLSLSPSHALSLHTRYTTNFTNVSTSYIKVCALSHIYTYMTFGLFTYLSFPIGQADRNRVFGHPVPPDFHPEGPVSQHVSTRLPIIYHLLSSFSLSLIVSLSLSFHRERRKQKERKKKKKRKNERRREKKREEKRRKRKARKKKTYNKNKEEVKTKRKKLRRK